MLRSDFLLTQDDVLKAEQMLVEMTNALEVVKAKRIHIPYAPVEVSLRLAEVYIKRVLPITYLEIDQSAFYEFLSVGSDVLLASSVYTMMLPFSDDQTPEHLKLYTLKSLMLDHDAFNRFYPIMMGLIQTFKISPNILDRRLTFYLKQTLLTVGPIHQQNGWMNIHPEVVADFENRVEELTKMIKTRASLN